MYNLISKVNRFLVRKVERPSPASSYRRTTGRGSRHRRRVLAFEVLEDRCLLVAGPSDSFSQLGQWGPVLDWGAQAKTMVLLPTGDVLVWSTGDSARVWDSRTDASFTPVPFLAGDLHCAAQATLADGRVIVVGGQQGNPHSGTTVTSLFDPFTKTWNTGAPMNRARWYATATVLPDGRVLASSGDDAQGKTVTVPEVYDPTTNQWTQLTGADRLQGLYPLMFVLPDGHIYEAGSDTNTWLLDVGGAGSWSPGPTNSFGSSGYAESAAMYAPGKIIRSGGGDPAIAKAAVVDMTAPSPGWRDLSPMNFPRRRHNMVILADGEVMAVGGTRQADDAQAAILNGEIWDPATEQWTVVAAMSEARMYHSTALLLPDGRVLVGGGEDVGRLHAQIYTPPYLFRGPRPTITSAPDIVSYSRQFVVRTPDAANIGSVALIRPSAVTHAFDHNERYVPLAFTQSSGELAVSAPLNANVAPPGYYMLVIKDSAGVPSVASWVRVDATADLQPGVIAGRVTDNKTGIGIRGAKVSYGGGLTATDGTGSFTLQGVPSGDHQVTVSAPGFATVTRFQRVRPLETVTLDVQLTTAGTVRGRVSAIGTGAAIPGAAIIYAGGSVTAGASGDFLLADLVPGTQEIFVSAIGYQGSSQLVTVQPRASVTLNVALAAGSTVVQGDVDDRASGDHVAGAVVRYSGGSTTTDETGFYRLENVPPGTHIVTVSASGYVSSSAQATVVSGFPATVDFALAPILAPGSTVTIPFQDGVFPDRTYSGTRDSFIRSLTTTRNYGSAAVLETDGNPDDAVLLKWDLTAIRPGNKVRSATVTLNVVNTTIHVYEFYELRRNWVEGEVTWNVSSTGNSWGVAGAQGVADHGSTVLGTVTASALGTQSVSLNAAGLAVVQSWIDNPAANFGFILQDYSDATSDDLDFSSREMTAPENRPKLSVTYDANGELLLSPIGDKSVNEGSPLSFTISAAGADPNAMSYSAQDLPAGAIFNPATRTISWTPSETQDGTYTVTFSVRAGSATDSEAITITVAEVNVAPVLTPIGKKWVPDGSPLSFTISATDADSVRGLPTTLSYSASGLPKGAVFTPLTRTFSWTPTTAQKGSYNVRFAVSDGVAEASETIVITVVGRNQVPMLVPIGNKSVVEGSPLTFTVAGTVGNKKVLTYAASGLPEGATFDSVTHAFSWTPAETQDGTPAVTFSVTDGRVPVAETITLTVTELNQPPVLTPIGNRTVTEGNLLSFSIAATDADLVNGSPNTLSYSATGLPMGATFNPDTRSFNWTPAETQDGTFKVTFNVNDGTATVSETVTLTVGELNQPPVLAPIGNRSVSEGPGAPGLSFTIAATDLDIVNGSPNALIYSASGLPAGATFNPDTRTFNWAPAENQDGTYSVTFSTSDGVATVSETITLTVQEVNQPPVLGPIGKNSVKEGSLLSFTITATDADLVNGLPNTLSYSASGLPAGATFDPSTRKFSWTPSEAQDGTYKATFSVSDGLVTSSNRITITVVEVNQSPVLAEIGNKSVNHGRLLSFTLSATDTDVAADLPNLLSYSAVGLPTGANFDPATRTFSWTPTETQDGTYSVTFNVNDGLATDSKTIAIAVHGINQTPVLGPIGNKSVNEATRLSFTISGTDANQDTLTYSVTSLPAGASFDPGSRFFGWTPGETQAGTYSVTFSVSDGAATASETIAIVVREVNQPPVLGSIGNKSVDEGSLLSFTISATDADQNALTFSVSNLPAGAKFDPFTRTFSWTPAETQDGTYSVTFSVSDGAAAASETIEIVVREVNQPPVLGPIGNKSVNEGSLLIFTVSGTDTDQVNGSPNRLTYSASGLPVGATFTPASGTFSWTPAEGQHGDYSVTFSTSDGVTTVSVTITITVSVSYPGPVLAPIGSKSVKEGSLLSFTVSATDSDRSYSLLKTLAYSASGLPGGATFDPKTGTFSWTPSETQDGSFRVTFIVSNGLGTTLETVRIDVGEVNQSPVLRPIGNKSVPEGSLLMFTISATDADLVNGLPNLLSYSAGGLPAGASFNPATRTFSWTPTETQDGTSSVTFSAGDGAATASETILITVGEVNQPPVLLPIGNRSVNEGSLLSFTISATDADRVNGSPNTLGYSASGLPVGASFDPGTGTFSWTPAESQDGSYTVTFGVSDGLATASQAVTLTVAEVNQAPVLSLGNRSVNEASLLNFTVSATDVDRVNGSPNPLSYSVSDLPVGATFKPSTGTFSWVPAETQDGSYRVTFSASDGAATASQTITITVAELNQPPVLAPIGNKSVDKDSLLSFTISATDADRVNGSPNPLSYSASGLPAGAAFSPVTGTFSWSTLGAGDAFHRVTFGVSDGSATVSETITITVGKPNHEPVMAPVGNRSLMEGSLLSFAVSATDADQDALAYSVQRLPAGASFNPVTGTFSWTPAEDQDGDYSLTFDVTDGKSTASQTVAITVTEVNQPPVLAPIGNRSVAEGSLLSFTPVVTDVDRVNGAPNTLSYSVGGLPAGANFDPVTRAFSWTPTETQDGSYRVTFSVSDGQATVFETLTITAVEVNQPPVLAPIGDQSVKEGSLVNFTVSATDSDRVNGLPNTLSYSTSSLPAGASFDPVTRAFSWTPTETQDGSYRVTFSISDGQATVFETLTITVVEVNQPPVLAPIGDQSVKEGSPLSLTISGTDTDLENGLPNPLSYSATGLPAGANLDPITHAFSWTPAESQDGSYRVTFSTGDGRVIVSQTITITVIEVNQAPLLAPIGDQSVKAGSLLKFSVSATDADLVNGLPNTLSYSAVGLPAGASFDPATRAFSWTPADTQGGSYTVTFGVSDGKATVSETITITVVEGGAASATPASVVANSGLPNPAGTPSDAWTRALDSAIAALARLIMMLGNGAQGNGYLSDGLGSLLLLDEGLVRNWAAELVH